MTKDSFMYRLFYNQYKHRSYLVCIPMEMVLLWFTVFRYSVLMISFSGKIAEKNLAFHFFWYYD